MTCPQSPSSSHLPDEPPSTRDRLLVAARDLFMVQGYSSTGIAQILKTAGARSGSLYHFFPTKEDLLLAVLDWYLQNIQSALFDPVWQRVDDPIERIFALLDGYRKMLTFTEFRHGCPIGNLALEVSETHPQARNLINQNFQVWLKSVASCFAQSADRLPEGTDPQKLAIFVLTTMEGAVMLARSYRSLDPFDIAVTQLRDYLDRLLADGSTWSSPRPHPASDFSLGQERAPDIHTHNLNRKDHSHDH